MARQNAIQRFALSWPDGTLGPVIGMIVVFWMCLALILSAGSGIPFLLIFLPPAFAALGTPAFAWLFERLERRLSFRHESHGWGAGVRIEPPFLDREQGVDHATDFLDGTFRGETVRLYVEARRKTTRLGALEIPVTRLFRGAVGEVAEHEFPWLEVRDRDSFPRPAGTVLDDAPASTGRDDALTSDFPVEGFAGRFDCTGDLAARPLLSETTQRVLLGLPRSARVVVVGARLRLEIAGGWSLVLPGGANRLLERSLTLRDALAEAGYDFRAAARS